MDIQFSPMGVEALLLKDTAERFIADTYNLPQRFKMLTQPADTCPQHWQVMADLGWLAAPLREDVGGLGVPASQLVPMLGVLGAGLILEPYGPAIMRCAATLARLLPAADATDTLAPMLAGERIEVLVAVDVAITATPTGTGWVLTGTALIVPAGACAQVFWTVAKCGNELALFRVPASDVTVTPYRLLDGQAAAKLVFDAVTCPEDTRFRYTKNAADYGEDMALFGALAETNGVIDALYQATLDYVKLREQFGRPIGRFQTVQHRMAEMFIRREEVVSMTQLAAHAMDGDDLAFRRRILSAAKVKAADAGRAVLRDAVQLHGGIGMTDEMKIGHLVKRLLVLGQIGGTKPEHLARFQALA